MERKGNTSCSKAGTNNISHQPTDTYRYSAFGEETTFGVTLNPWRFASKRVDLESGFSFFGRRYYSPTVGRFLTPDPIGFADGPNLYAYVHNSPMVYVDAFGLIGEATSGAGLWNSLCDSISGWFGGGSSSGTSETTNSSHFPTESGQTASSPQSVKECVLNDGTKILENRYYHDCVVIYPDGNILFLEQNQGQNLKHTVGGPILQGGGVTNYVAAGDPVSMFAMHCCGLQEDPYFDDILHHTHYVGSMTDPLTAHSFSGPGYREALEQIFNERG